MDITNTRRSSLSNTQPTRIKSFCRQNQNSPLRIILPILYMSLSILYFYNLLSRNVGSGVHVLHDNNIRQNNTTHAPASIWNGGSKSESPAVQLEPRSLADVTIANAQVAWKKQIEHQNYLRRRAEKREEQRKQREDDAKLVQKTSSNQTAAATRVEQTNNGTAIVHYTLANGTEKTLVLRTPNNNNLTKEEEDEYVRKLSKFAVKRTPPNKTGRRRGQKINGDAGFVPVLIMITVCTIFRVGINLVIGRLADLSLATSSIEDGNEATTNDGTPLSALFGGGREARALRRRARAVRAQRQFQRFVDRLNAEREANGERPVTADTLRHLVNSRDFNGNDYDQLHNFVDENGPAAMSYFSAIGATEAEINRLPRRTIEANDDLLSRPGVGGQQQQQCSICLEQFQVGETVRTIPCFHTFHSSCVDPWLATKSECPICKHSAIG